MWSTQQGHWYSLDLGVVMPRTSSVKYWSSASHAKTYNLQVWAQRCHPKMQSGQFQKLFSSCREPMLLDADFLVFLKHTDFEVWCQMYPTAGGHWDSLGFVVVIAQTSSVKYWFLAAHAKTYHLQAWAQSCPKKNKVCNSGNCSAHVEDQCGWILIFWHA